MIYIVCHYRIFLYRLHDPKCWEGVHNINHVGPEKMIGLLFMFVFNL